MIRIERVGLPPGMKAFARRENGTVFVYVSAGLSPGQRLEAIRQALRAAPDAGWRSGRHPVLLPALAGGAGLRSAPGGRWPYWVLLTAAVAAVASVIAMTVLRGGGAPRHGGGPGVALQPGGSSSPGQASGPGGTRSSAPSGSVPAGPDERKPGPRAPKPQTTGTPVPVPTPGGSPTPGTSPTPGRSPTQPPPSPSGAPTPSPSTSTAPAPPGPSPSGSPSPSPSGKPTGSSPQVCVDVLGVTVCV
jgi:hypothetical protein